MTTGNDWLSTTRSYLMSGMRENRNKLSQPYVKGSGQLTFQYAILAFFIAIDAHNPLEGMAKTATESGTFIRW